MNISNGRILGEVIVDSGSFVRSLRLPCLTVYTVHQVVELLQPSIVTPELNERLETSSG